MYGFSEIFFCRVGVCVHTCMRVCVYVCVSVCLCLCLHVQYSSTNLLSCNTRPPESRITFNVCFSKGSFYFRMLVADNKAITSASQVALT